VLHMLNEEYIYREVVSYSISVFIMYLKRRKMP
jgi:hypothetical protein